MPAQQGGGRGAAQTICVERKQMLSSPLHHPSGGPPPPLRGGGCAASFSRHIVPELHPRPRADRLAPGNQRVSGAPRGASNQCRATPTHVAMSRRLGRGARRRQVYAICATHLLPGRARLPALCCGSRQGFDPLTQLQAMLPGTRVEAGVTRPLLSQSRDSTSRRGPRAAGHDAQSRPGAECIVPRAGTAPAPSFESALAKGALS
jgi:hypothetical protein